MGLLFPVLKYGAIGVGTIVAVGLIVPYIDSKAENFWRFIFWIIGLGTVIDSIIQPRNSIQIPIASYLTWFSRSLFLFIMFIGLVGFSYIVLLRKPIPKHGRTLWLGIMLFSIEPIVMVFVSTDSSFSYGQLLIPALFSSVYLLPRMSLFSFVKDVKAVLLVYVYGSLFSAIIAPNWALDLFYSSGIIPGLSVRLNGLVTQANGLAPLVILYIILDLYRPNKGLVGKINYLFSVLVIILCQSKTIWVIYILVYIVRYFLNLKISGRNNFLKLSFILNALVLFFITCYFTWPVIAHFSATANIDSIDTLTGRTIIWDYTFEVWKHNPWFGYGPELWNLDMREAWGMPFAGQAHNQFIQSLGESGVFGEINLVVYNLILVYFGCMLRKQTNGVSLYLIIFLLGREMTEAPLRNYGVNSALYMHFIIYAFLAFSLKQIQRGGASAKNETSCSNDVPQSKSQDDQMHRNYLSTES